LSPVGHKRRLLREYIELGVDIDSSQLVTILWVLVRLSQLLHFFVTLDLLDALVEDGLNLVLI
jgi:hypothetical protein